MSRARASRLASSEGEVRSRVSEVTVSMPAFASSLSENDRWDLVNYLRSVYSSSDTTARP